ncbi:putative quinol monooxygenase [Rhizobium leguminosarum]|uniref:putative quinol monooxygenase n=1 Tax=Rhizobium leguminosarum TaxID=384 RepID=UPI0024B35D3B|nr:putative quinol monooxygenase [Rhizobium leguminosarum]WHO82810.1 antibiotic biosynthesis monooxygenase [Rhizobium leguminosarum]
MVELAVTPDSGAAFERAFAVQAAAVQANEPGNRLYELFKSTTLSDSYTLVEIYEDDAALQAHRASPHMAANRPLTAPFLAGPPVCRCSRSSRTASDRCVGRALLPRRAHG